MMSYFSKIPSLRFQELFWPKCLNLNFSCVAVHVSQVGGFYTEGINSYTIINNLTIFGTVIEYFKFC